MPLHDPTPRAFASDTSRSIPCRTLATLLASAMLASCGGGGTGSAASKPQVAIVRSLGVSASVQQLTIHPGDGNVPLDVSVGAVEGYDGPVLVTLTGLPSGVSVTPVVLAPGQSGTLYLDASPAADQEQFPADGTSSGAAQDTAVTVVAAAGSLQATAPLTLTTSLSDDTYAPAKGDVDLPVVAIDTGGVAIADKTTNVPGTITVTSADGATSYLPSASATDDTATFHLHGNSTASMPKKPYHVKLGTGVDLLAAMGLPCGYVTSAGKATCDKSKTYVLLANYDDKTLLRDWSASALANAIPMGGAFLSSPATSPSPSGTGAPMPWAPHSMFVELYVNGAYQGNYQLIEEVKVDSHRVDISELDETDTTGDLSGGYLLEIDTRADEAFTFQTPAGVPIGVVDPDFSPDPEVAAQTSYISAYVDQAETALYGPDFADPALGWRAYFDETAAVNFFLVNELLGNVDGGAMFSSDYLYKNKDDPLLYMGPVWDFDISSGNVNYQPVVDPTVPWMSTTAWYARWFQDAGFAADAARQWNALKSGGVLANWTSAIATQAAALQKSQANNARRWPMQGLKVWPNPQASGSYAGELGYLQNWLALRTAMLDSRFNAKTPSTTTLSLASTDWRAGTAATLTAQVSAGDAPGGSVYFLDNGVIVGTATLDADGQAQLVTGALPAGAASIKAVYAGDATHALSASAAQSATVAAARIATAVSVADLSTSATGSTRDVSVAVIPASGTATPTGSVQVMRDGVVLGTATLSNGVASLAVSASGGTLQATYGGDASYLGATSSTTSLGQALGGGHGGAR